MNKSDVIFKATDFASGSFTDVSLQLAINYIGSDYRVLYINGGEWLISNDITFPSNIDVIIEKGSTLKWTSTSINIIINTLSHTLYGIFNCPSNNLPTINSPSALPVTFSLDGSLYVPVIGSTSYTLPIASNTVLGGIKVGSNLSIDGNGVLSSISYSLPIASNSVLGGIKVGSNLSIDENGILSTSSYNLPIASGSTLGGIKVGSNLSINDQGVLSTTLYTLPIASGSTLGGIKVGDNLSIDLNGVLSAENGVPTLTVNQLLYGANDGSISQSANLTFTSNNLILGAGYVDSKTYYYINGNKVLSVDGIANTFFGINCGIGNTGSYNTIIGYDCMKLVANSGNYNVSMGYQCLANNGTGAQNTAIGTQILVSNTTGNSNTGIGYYCLKNNMTGGGNVAIGSESCRDLIDGIYNVGLGQGALISGYHCNYSVAIGCNTLPSANGDMNIAIGYVTLHGLSGNTGSYNVAIGSGAGYSLVTGDHCVFIGHNAGYYETNSNRLYISNSTTTTPLIYGEFDNLLLRVNGDLDIKSGYGLTLNSLAPSGQYIRGNGTRGVYSALQYSDLPWTLTSGYLPYYNGTTLTNSPFFTNGTFTNIGSIVDQGALFAVFGTITPQITVGDTTAYDTNVGGKICFSGKYDATHLTPFGAIKGYKENATENNYLGGLIFYYDNASATLTEGMRLNSSGYLGIGTPSPSANLHIYNSLYSEIKINAGNGTGRTWSINVPIAGTSLRFGRSGVADDFIIDNDGNIGIGTIGALGKLCINGGVHVGGDSNAGDNNLLVDGNIYVGTTTEYFSNSSNDVLLTTTANKTLKLNSVVYEDLQFDVSSGKVPASNAPNWEAFTTNTSEYAFDVDEFIDLKANEPSHSWIEASTLDFHAHVTIKAAQNSGANRYAKFTIWVAYADYNNSVWTEVSPISAELTIPNGASALTEYYLDLGDVIPTGLHIGSQFKARIKRIAATGGTEYASSVFITQVGAHHQKDTIGSRSETSK